MGIIQKEIHNPEQIQPLSKINGEPRKSLYDIRLEERTEDAITAFSKSNDISISFDLEEKLRDIIVQSIKLNSSQKWIPYDKIDLIRTPEDMLALMRLRSEVYAPLPGYSEEFPNYISNMLFDDFDKSSIIFIHKRGDDITGSIRIVLDNENGLPTEEKFSFDYLRNDHNIAEFSRQVIHPDYQNKGTEFRKFYSASYGWALMNGIDMFLAGIDREHLKLYQKFGGINVEQELDGYGMIKRPFLITSWDISQISPYFRKTVLKENSFRRDLN